MCGDAFAVRTRPLRVRPGGLHRGGDQRQRARVGRRAGPAAAVVEREEERDVDGLVGQPGALERVPVERPGQPVGLRHIRVDVRPVAVAVVAQDLELALVVALARGDRHMLAERPRRVVMGDHLDRVLELRVLGLRLGHLAAPALLHGRRLPARAEPGVPGLERPLDHGALVLQRRRLLCDRLGRFRPWDPDLLARVEADRVAPAPELVLVGLGQLVDRHAVLGGDLIDPLTLRDDVRDGRPRRAQQPVDGRIACAALEGEDDGHVRRERRARRRASATRARAPRGG